MRQQSKMLAELICEHHLDSMPEVGGKCLLHVHCHEKAVLDAGAARRVLEKMDMEVNEPEPGCCGMAGSFGFEARHAGLSREIGEMRLLPAVREASPDDPIVIEGFSCREQVRQGTGRAPVHLAEVVAGAIAPRASEGAPRRVRRSRRS